MSEIMIILTKNLFSELKKHGTKGRSHIWNSNITSKSRNYIHSVNPISGVIRHL